MLRYIFHPPANFIRERKRLKYESNGFPQKTYRLDKDQQLQAPCLKQDKKANQTCVKALQALRTLWLPWKTEQIHGPMCFTNND